LSSLAELHLGSFSAGATVSAAISAVDAVHLIDSSEPVRIELDPGMTRPALYSGQADGSAPNIYVHPNVVRPGLTTLHEIGHYLDHALIDTVGVHASPASPLLDRWRRTVRETDAISELQRLASKPPLVELRTFFEEQLTLEELFARSYAQWIAIRAGDDTLLDELNDALSTLNYPDFWGYDDFQPTADALDSLFEELQWKPQAA
jgi:hypothetical protein